MTPQVLLALAGLALAVARLAGGRGREDSRLDETGEPDWSAPTGAVEEVLSEAEGTPYAWGGGRAAGSWPEGSPGLLGDAPGFDCSAYAGAALEELGAALDWPRSEDSVSKFWSEAREIVTDVVPEPGALVFYGDPEAPSHVMIGGNEGRVWGSVGGDSSTDGTDPSAYVTVREWDYRSDYIGWAPFDSWGV